MVAAGQFKAQFGGDYATSAISWITGNANLHAGSRDSSIGFRDDSRGCSRTSSRERQQPIDITKGPNLAGKCKIRPARGATRRTRLVASRGEFAVHYFFRLQAQASSHASSVIRIGLIEVANLTFLNLAWSVADAGDNIADQSFLRVLR